MIPGRVVADEREKASGVPDALSKLGVRVYFSNLPVADYVISPEVAVERKSVRDLVSSIYDSRIFQQAAKISASYAKPYLLVEGDSKEVGEVTNNTKSFYGAIANVTLAYGLRVICTSDPSETAVALSELLAHSRARPPAGMVAEPPPKAKTLPLQQVYIVSSIPGIGRKLAEKLLSKYGTPRRVMGLTTGELALTGGVGWKRAERVKSVLDTPYSKHRPGDSQSRLGQE